MEVLFMDSPWGKIGLGAEGDFITRLFFSPAELPASGCLFSKNNAVLLKGAKQLEEYFNGRRREFSLPLHYEGTDFQKKCWKALIEIPYGETRTYLDIARAAGNEKAARAAGMANNKNPLPIFIPCHRVIGSNGKLVGFRGGLEVKRLLLEIEGVL